MSWELFPSFSKPTLVPFLSQMEYLPRQLLLMIFRQFVPPPVCDTPVTNDTPIKEEVKLLNHLATCKSVCKEWREIVEEEPLLLSYHVYEGGPVPSDNLRVKGTYVKRLLVGKVSSAESTLGNDLAVFPNVMHISWICEISCDKYLRHASYPRFQHLRRLDWRFSGDFENSAGSFTKIVEHSPVLEYITATETAEAPLNGCWHVCFRIPDSVTTLGLFCHQPTVWRLLWWIRDSWGKGASLDRVITSGTYPAFGFPAIELRPNPNSTTKPSKSALEDFVRECFIQSGTLTYSCTVYAPPERYDLIPPRRSKHVNKIALMTSGSSYKTEVEKWAAVQQHLDFILKVFRNLTSVDLYDDFQEWKEDDVMGEVLETFEKSAQQFSIAVRYMT